MILAPAGGAVDTAGASERDRPEPVGPAAPSGRLGRWGPPVGAAALLAAAEASVAVGAYLPFVSPLVGFAACFAVPLVFVYRLLGRGRWSLGGERLVVAVAATVLIVILASLADNTFLPWLGVSRPLDTWPVLITADAVDAALAALAWRCAPVRGATAAGRPQGWRGGLCASAAVASVPLAAMGAVRVNNGAGAGLTLFDLGLIVVVLALLLAWRDVVTPVIAPLTIYSVSLALLFMTSLRGWYTTGHDVQHEMMAFLATADPGRWNPTIHDGYTACLSITMLPTVFLHWTRVADPYVFKVFFQLLYAFCPVAVYYLGRRIASEAMSLVSTFFFVGFVGYLQDMPMLNRQEVGFLFFSTALLAMFVTEWSRRWRWTAFCGLGTGMVLSHYSTAYFACAALIGALGLRLVVVDLLPRFRPRWNGPLRSWAHPDLLGWRPALAVLALTVVWNGPVNHSGGAVFTQLDQAIQGAIHGSSTREASVGYSLAGPGRGLTRSDAVTSLMAAEARLRDRYSPWVVPAPAPGTALTPLAPTEMLPLTRLGHNVLGSQARALTFNRVWRTVSAWTLQALLVAGMVVILLRRRAARGVPMDAFLLGGVMASLLALQVLLPSLSLDYGVGRSFMQALMVLGPVMAIGAAELAGVLRVRNRVGAAFGIAGAIFVSTSGLVPQLVGGYGPQLHLDNSGIYYDRYLIHPQEVAVVDWLKTSVIATSPRYPDIQMDQDLFNKTRSLGGIRAYDDIYPSDIFSDAYVVLGPTNLVAGRLLETYDGYDLWLQYPTGVLDRGKSLIYNNGITRIYR